MNIDATIDEISKIANRAYAGANPADRLAFENGMLISALRKMSCLLDNAKDHCKQLEIELMHKENI